MRRLHRGRLDFHDRLHVRQSEFVLLQALVRETPSDERLRVLGVDGEAAGAVALHLVPVLELGVARGSVGIEGRLLLLARLGVCGEGGGVALDRLLVLAVLEVVVAFSLERSGASQQSAVGGIEAFLLGNVSLDLLEFGLDVVVVRVFLQALVQSEDGIIQTHQAQQSNSLTVIALEIHPNKVKN